MTLAASFRFSFNVSTLNGFAACHAAYVYENFEHAAYAEHLKRVKETKKRNECNYIREKKTKAKT